MKKMILLLTLCAGAASAQTFTAGGDLSGSNTSQQVIGLRGVPISSTPATSGQNYTLVSGIWTPTNPSSSPGGSNGNIQANISGAFGPASLLNMGSSLTNATDGSFIINNSTYTPYTLGSGNFGNVFLGTGPIAYGSGVVGGFTGNNIGIGQQALKSAVNPGSVVAIGVQACMDENGNGNTDPGAGNGVCLGTNAGSNDAHMSDFIVIGQKAYTDVTAGSVGGLAGTVIIGVHTDGIDGWTGSVAVGNYIARSTNNQPVTGGSNTVIGESNFNCTSCTTTPSAPTSINNATVVGNSNMAGGAFGNDYAVALGIGNLNKFTGGNMSGGAISSNVAVGNNNLQQVITGLNNVAVGNNALQAATGSNSTAIGASACNRTSTGSCTALGFNSAGFNTTSTVTAIGVNAAGHATGNNLTAIGQSSAFNVTGIQNVYIGDIAGSAAGAALTTQWWASAQGRTIPPLIMCMWVAVLALRLLAVQIRRWALARCRRRLLPLPMTRQ